MIPTCDLSGEGETTPLTTPLNLTRSPQIRGTYPLCCTGHFTTESFFRSQYPTTSRCLRSGNLCYGETRTSFARPLIWQPSGKPKLERQDNACLIRWIGRHAKLLISHRHEVRFYSDDGYFLDIFTQFIGAALNAGNAVGHSGFHRRLPLLPNTHDHLDVHERVYCKRRHQHQPGGGDHWVVPRRELLNHGFLRSP